MSSNRKSNILIGCWNINQLKSKTHDKSTDPLFLNAIARYDIIGLLETKLTDTVSLNGFLVYPFYRPVSGKNRCVSGGLALAIRANVRKGIKFLVSPMPLY